MDRLTEEQARSYYTHCPTCDSRDFYSYSLMGEGCEMWQKFRCDDCEAVWIEVFLLYRIEKGD
jgi:transposase-like protein